MCHAITYSSYNSDFSKHAASWREEHILPYDFLINWYFFVILTLHNSANTIHLKEGVWPQTCTCPDGLCITVCIKDQSHNTTPPRKVGSGSKKKTTQRTDAYLTEWGNGRPINYRCCLEEAAPHATTGRLHQENST